MPFFVAATITLCATPAFGQDDDGGARAGDAASFAAWRDAFERGELEPQPPQITGPRLRVI